MKENPQQLAGYARLFERHDLDVDLLWRRSIIRRDTRPRATDYDGGQVIESFPRKYMRGDSDFDHLVFALKYDGVNPYALVKAFQATDRDELTRRIRAQPTSQYARRLAFFCEKLAGYELELEDAREGPWVPAADPREQLCSEGRRLRRYRVEDNLLGGHGMCPLVRRTKELELGVARQLGARALEITRNIEPRLVGRITRYLYTKETKSSFEIERERPGTRIERYLEQLAGVARLPLDTVGGLVELQNSLVDPRYADAGVRGPGEDEVYVGETIRWHERVHFIGAPSRSTPELVEAWLVLREPRGPGASIVEAAMRSFSFVFIHPFSDGNGRLHRLLMHHVLAKRGFTPRGFVIPISAVLLADQRSYDEALEEFSTKVMRHTPYTLDSEGRLTIESTDLDLYRYPDLTVQTAATFTWLEKAIEDEFAGEADFLRRYDRTVARMRDVVEMPDRKEQLFVHLCRHNGGHLSPGKRARLFAELEDEQIVELESIVREAMGIG